MKFKLLNLFFIVFFVNSFPLNVNAGLPKEGDTACLAGDGKPITSLKVLKGNMTKYTVDNVNRYLEWAQTVSAEEANQYAPKPGGFGTSVGASCMGSMGSNRKPCYCKI